MLDATVDFEYFRDWLIVLDATVDFEYFRDWLIGGLGYGDGIKGGRPPFDPVTETIQLRSAWFIRAW